MAGAKQSTYDVFVLAAGGEVPKRGTSWVPGGKAEKRFAKAGRPYLDGYFDAPGGQRVHFRALPTPALGHDDGKNGRPIYNLFLLTTYLEIPTDRAGHIVDQKQPVWRNKSKSKGRTFLRCQVAALSPPLEIQLWHSVTPKAPSVGV